MRNFKTLVLNATYRPLSIISWERAIVLVAEQRVIELDFYTSPDGEVLKIKDGHNRHYTIPAVVALRKFIKRGMNKAPFCKKNVYLRDGLTCQYCGNHHPPSELTFDHVIPRSKWTGKGSPTTWENIVTCCYQCNRRKGDRTCEEARMFPLTKPVSPKYGEMFLGLSPWRESIPREWIPHLQHLPLFKGLRDES